MFDKILKALFGESQPIRIEKPTAYNASNRGILSPLEGLQPTPSPSPSPSPMLDQIEELYRNPKIKGYLDRSGGAVKPDEMLSGTKLASEKYGVPQALLMDMAGLESTAGKYGGEENSSGAAGPFQFLKSTGRSLGIEPDERYSATDSAMAASRGLLDKRLAEWDIIDKPGAGGDKLTDFWSEEELSPYISKSGEQRRSMLQKIAEQLLGNSR